MRTSILAITGAGAFIATSTPRARRRFERARRQRYRLYNLAGVMRVEGASGGDVVVE